MINPNFKHLRVFIEIARRGSFRNAANALHLSEPATSQAITQLESLIKVKLLDRTTRSVRLTEAGLTFLLDAEKMLDGMDRAIVGLRDFAASGRERVSLACLSSTVFHLLPPVLVEMKRLYPAINVIFLDDTMRGILRSLENSDCDLAIVSEDSLTKAELTIPLVEDTFQLVCSRDHPLGAKRQVTGHDLSAHELLLLRRGSGIRDVFDRAIEPLGIDLKIVYETTQVHTLLGLVEAGLGVTVLPSMLCPGPSNTALAVRPIQNPLVSRRLGIVFPEGKEPSPAAQLLAEVVRQTVGSETMIKPCGVHSICL